MTPAQKSKNKASQGNGRSEPPQGRCLRRFTLKGVRTFRAPATLDFSQADGSIAQWTVILGENGKGKTTLLQYLAGMVLTNEYTVPATEAEARGSRWSIMSYAPMLVDGIWEQWHFGNASTWTTKPRSIEAEIPVSTATSSITLADHRSEKAKLLLEWSLLSGKQSLSTIGHWLRYDPTLPEQLRIFGYGASRMWPVLLHRI